MKDNNAVLPRGHFFKAMHELHYSSGLFLADEFNEKGLDAASSSVVISRAPGGNHTEADSAFFVSQTLS